MKILGFLFITFTLAISGMEMPRVFQVPTLVELASRQCKRIVEPFDPNQGYARAVKNLESRAITHVVGNKLAPQLAHINMQRLQILLDYADTSQKIKTEYNNPAHNLYENDHGVYDVRKAFFKPHFKDKPKTKYKRLMFSDDNTICVTRSGLSVTLWDVASGNPIKQLHYPLNGQNYDNLFAIKFSPDKNMLFAHFTEELDNVQGGKPCIATHMCAFDVASGQMLYENLHAGWGFIVGNKYIYLPKQDGLHVHDSVTNVLHKILPILAGVRRVNYCISPDDHFVCHVPVEGAQNIEVYGLPQGNLIHRLTGKEKVLGMRLNEWGTRLAALTTHNICVWAPRKGELVATISHAHDADLQLIDFADNDRIIYTRAKNIITAWNIEAKKPLIKKEVELIPNQPEVKYQTADEVLSVEFIKNEQSAMVWTRKGGHQIHSLYSVLGEQLSLKELSALLVLEYEDQHELPFSPAAVEIVSQTENEILRKIYKNRYECVSAEKELECAAQLVKNRKPHN